MRPTCVEINLSALKHNFSVIKEKRPQSHILSVVKADAYGHGVERVVNSLSTLTNGFGVATVEEGVEVRTCLTNQDNGLTEDAKSTLPIVILSSFSQFDDCRLLLENQLTPVISNQHQLAHIENSLKEFAPDKPLPIWIKVDSGMHRWGVQSNELITFIDRLNDLIRTHLVKVEVIASHFACSDELENTFTLDQYEQFTDLVSQVKSSLIGSDEIKTSIQNSAACLQWKDIETDWIRPGRALYGSSPFDHLSPYDFDLKPVMNFVSKVVDIKYVKEGQSVGYGQKFIADKDVSIALIPCGYADGYPRQTQSGAPVLVNHQQASIAGRVSMDAIAIDVTDLDVHVGDEVMLWGDELLVEIVCPHSNSIPHDMLTRVGNRVPRVYLEDNLKS